jgi:hypothetical protein
MIDSSSSSSSSSKSECCQLQYNGNDLSISYDPSDFSFKDFDYYVRRRFGIFEEQLLRYSAGTGELEDVLPSPNLMKRLKGSLHIFEEASSSSSSSSAMMDGGAACNISSDIIEISTGLTNKHNKNKTNSKSTSSKGSAKSNTNANVNDNSKSSSTETNSVNKDKESVDIFGSFSPIRSASNNALMRTYTSMSTSKSMSTGSGGSSYMIYGMETTINWRIWASRCIPTVLVLLAAIILAPTSMFGTVIDGNAPMRRLLDYLETLAQHIGLPTTHEWHTLFVEACITFIIRAFTELFFRRLVNPENDITRVIPQYSVDAVFAGIAAGMMVFFKKMAITNMKS